MARLARNLISDIPYHIIHRGNNRQQIFYKKNDYEYFIKLMKEAKRKYSCKLYSYVLMPNHIHIILETSDDSENISLFMKYLAQMYSQYINYVYKKTGSLWEGRYKSSVITKDQYLLLCSRYIEINPVRANIVENPQDYYWSSYRFKIGIEDNNIIDQDPVYREMGDNNQEMQNNYKKFVEEGIQDEELQGIRKAVQGNSFFGNDEFKKQIEKKLGRRFRVGIKGRPIK